jgi:hypothetical protein
VYIHTVELTKHELKYNGKFKYPEKAGETHRSETGSVGASQEQTGVQSGINQ